MARSTLTNVAAASPPVRATTATAIGIVLAIADTGFSGSHPALRPHYRGTVSGSDAYAWHDAVHDADLVHIQARHEQGAGHMAQGYARATGRVGVAMATSGPGATFYVGSFSDGRILTGNLRTAEGLPSNRINGITAQLPLVLPHVRLRQLRVQDRRRADADGQHLCS